MPSLTSRAMPLAIALLGRRRPSAHDIRREIAALQAKPKPFPPPASLGRSLKVTPATSAAGWPVFTVAPRGVAPSARVCICTAAPTSGRSRGITGNWWGSWHPRARR
ncbi:hypothetical protein [Prescottella agglutinans]|uniref:hypothetical protein n=1 Tax=Prescottella agglutinans TaxID=1644129 RepID=UPI00247594C7|nr:hypothetical protein [Prescottella agglutinans]